MQSIPPLVPSAAASHRLRRRHRRSSPLLIPSPPPLPPSPPSLCCSPTSSSHSSLDHCCHHLPPSHTNRRPKPAKLPSASSVLLDFGGGAYDDEKDGSEDCVYDDRSHGHDNEQLQQKVSGIRNKDLAAGKRKGSDRNRSSGGMSRQPRIIHTHEPQPIIVPRSEFKLTVQRLTSASSSSSSSTSTSSAASPICLEAAADSLQRRRRRRRSSATNSAIRTQKWQRGAKKRKSDDMNQQSDCDEYSGSEKEEEEEEEEEEEAEDEEEEAEDEEEEAEEEEEEEMQKVPTRSQDLGGTVGDIIGDLKKGGLSYDGGEIAMASVADEAEKMITNIAAAVWGGGAGEQWDPVEGFWNFHEQNFENMYGDYDQVQW